MAQQTAVDWLIEQLEQQVYRIDHKDNRIVPISFDDIIEIQKRAKAMEKEQITDAYWNGTIDMNKAEALSEAEEFYKETYKK